MAARESRRGGFEVLRARYDSLEVSGSGVRTPVTAVCNPECGISNPGIWSLGPLTNRPGPGGLTVTSSNPAFSQDMFAGYDQVYGEPRTRSTVTTVQGSVGKTFLLLAILSFTALVVVERLRHGAVPDGPAADLRDRRLHRGDDHDLQAHGRARSRRRSTRRWKASSWAPSRRSSR